MRIEVFLDHEENPIQVLTPPEKFKLDTTLIVDGPHQLTFKAIDKDGGVSERQITFNVQNGPAIAVHGLSDGDTLHGEIGVLANAYGARVGDEFEPQRMETPAPVPTWAWVLFLITLAWGAGYLSLEFSNHIEGVIPNSAAVSTQNNAANHAESGPAAASIDAANDWAALGDQVYGINCASCHQVAGTGLPGVFPPLVNNSVINNEDPTEHIVAILNGVANKIIDGVTYAAPMPPFGSMLNDAEVAAVVNHERTQWGNNGPLIMAADVAKQR